MSDPILHALTQSINQRRSVALATVVGGTGRFEASVGAKAVVWPDAEPVGALHLGALDARALADARAALGRRQHEMLVYDEADGQAQVFVEVQRRPPTLIIAGAGHVAQPLAEIAHLCNFYVIVLDDRTDFATKERFPTADEVIAGRFRPTLRQLPVDADTFIVLVTRGHQHDIDCLLEVKDRPAAYIGMIGSQRRITAVFELLEQEQGIPAETLERVYAPIGLDIGARTPAEIGVCVMAEIIKVFKGNRGTGASLSDYRRERLRLRRERAAKQAEQTP